MKNLSVLFHPFAYLILLTCLGLFSSCVPRQESEAMKEADQLWSELSTGWNEVLPGGETICSQGTPFSFYFHPGNRDKLMVFFQGGGACWNPINCDLTKSPTYDPVIDSIDYPGNRLRHWKGIFDFGNAANPFRDYSILLIPYCTGDIHIGNSDQRYGEGDSSFVIHHRGYINSMAALDWLEERVLEPATVFVTGASAGSLAAPVYTGILAKRYTEARITSLGDCSGAYRGKEVKNLIAKWGATKALAAADIKEPNSITGSTDITLQIARQNPDISFSEYNSAYDEAQQFFLSQLGERPDMILSYLQENMDRLEQNLPNYHYYLDTGKHHVILQYPEFYTTGVKGSPLREWVGELEATGDPGNVNCKPCD